MKRQTTEHASAIEGSIVSILLVDDEVRNLDVLESILTSPAYRLVRAQGAQEALMALIDGEFAVIILDIQMPGTSGIELAHLIKQRKRTQHIPIIFLTAYFQEDKDILQGYEVGAVDYLTKPLDSKILKSKVAVFAELFQKTRELAELNSAMEKEIARREKAEQSLRQTNSELESRVQERTAELIQANRAKDDFLANLSHELRTPLSPVLLLASESANDPELPEVIRANFGTIAKNVELEARLIDDLLDLTRISRGKLLLDMRSLDLCAILRDAIGIVQTDAENKQIDLTSDFGSNQHTVLGDAVRLQQIFWNVLKNAVKFTPEGGKITIEARTFAESGKTTVKIIDTGVGLTAGEINHIFNAFTQGDHAGVNGSRLFGGLGLGLTISRMLVELHSGVIHASSAGRDRGATFVIELPNNVPAEKENGSSAPLELLATSNPPNALKKKPGMRILLVEDHEATRTALAHLLARREFKVLTAATAAEARTLAQQEKFDLVVSDIGLPDGDGYALMSELREKFGLQGIALSGYGMEQDVARGQKAGFVAHLIKPIRVDSLEKVLSEVR